MLTKLGLPRYIVSCFLLLLGITGTVSQGHKKADPHNSGPAEN